MKGQRQPRSVSSIEEFLQDLVQDLVRLLGGFTLLPQRIARVPRPGGASAPGTTRGVPPARTSIWPLLLGFVLVAAMPAWHALFDAARFSAGQTVLIHAAAGGVGTRAVQLAKWKGARVIGTASKRNHDFLRTLGADETIDYTATRFEDVAHHVDVVLDTMAGDTQTRSWKVLKKGGILVSILTPPSAEEAAAHGVRQAFVFVQPNASGLAEIAKLVDSGKLKAILETILPLSEARQAQELNQAGHTRGKIVLRVV